MKCLSLPDLFSNSAYESPEEAILSFYRLLGWNATNTLNPTEIKIHPSNWNEYCQHFIDQFGTRGGLFFMNYGPSTDEKMELNKVFSPFH
jgi:hypothetical protein